MSRMMMISGLFTSVLLASGMGAGSSDKSVPEPGGLHGGPYVPWGMPPFVVHETPPPPGGAFEGRKLASIEEAEDGS